MVRELPVHPRRSRLMVGPEGGPGKAFAAPPLRSWLSAQLLRGRRGSACLHGLHANWTHLSYTSPACQTGPLNA